MVYQSFPRYQIWTVSAVIRTIMAAWLLITLVGFSSSVPAASLSGDLVSNPQPNNNLPANPLPVKVNQISPAVTPTQTQTTSGKLNLMLELQDDPAIIKYTKDTQ